MPSALNEKRPGDDGLRGRARKCIFVDGSNVGIRRIQDGECGSLDLIHSSAVSTFLFSGLNVAHPKLRKIISTSQGYWVDSIKQVCKVLDTGQILSKYHFSSHPVPAKAPLSSCFSGDLSSGKQGNLVILSREFKLPEWEGQLAAQSQFIRLQSCHLLELSLSLLKLFLEPTGPGLVSDKPFSYEAIGMGQSMQGEAG